MLRGSRGGSDLEIGYGAGREEIEAHRAAFARCDFIHDQTRLARAVDEHADFRLLDDDFRVKPRIAIGRGVDDLFILAGLLLAQALPTPVRMRYVLHGVGLPVCALGPEVERAEIDDIVRLFIHDSKSDSYEVALWRAALALPVKLDDPVGELVAVEPNHAGSLRRYCGCPVLFRE